MIEEFRKKKLREIKIWAWLAVILPITALAGMFFVWVFGIDTYVKIFMVIGSTAMFSVAVIWWWWAIWTVAKITDLLGMTADKMKDLKNEILSIRKEINDKK